MNRDKSSGIMEAMISVIVAVAENGVIGRPGKLLPWHLPDDLYRFRQITTGHPIIMGRKTYDTIGRPLPGRHNIIITRNKDFKAPGATVVSSLNEAIEAAKSDHSDEVFIVGGASLYEQALPLAQKLYLTRVHAEPEGSVFFHFDTSKWHEESSEHHPAGDRNDHDVTWQTLTRRADESV